MTTNTKTVAVIGTAGRKRMPTLVEYRYMIDQVSKLVDKDTILVSGGAAWADHVAVELYLQGLVAGLVLHLPAPFSHKYATTGQRCSGSVANYYHTKMSEVVGYDTLAQIEQALEKGAEYSEQPLKAGYSGLFNRNKLVAQADSLIACTFGTGDTPDSGGTLDTWNAHKGHKTHIPIKSTKEYTLSLDKASLQFKCIKQSHVEDLEPMVRTEPYMLDADTYHLKHFDVLPKHYSLIHAAMQQLGEYPNMSLYRLYGHVDMIPVPSVYLALGKVTVEVYSETEDGYISDLDAGDVMILGKGIQNYTVQVTGEKGAPLLMWGNHHNLVQFANSGVYYIPIYTSGKGGYECSSRGDKRFSALYAKLDDGRTIEQWYQCDVKGFDVGGTNIKLGKGKPPLIEGKNTAKEYLALWHKYLQLNPHLIHILIEAALSKGGKLNDMYATTQVNQANALACLLSLYQTDT